MTYDGRVTHGLEMGNAGTAVKSKERLDPRAVGLTLRDADDHRPALLDQMACDVLSLLRRDGATEQAQPVLGVTAIATSSRVCHRNSLRTASRRVGPT